MFRWKNPLTAGAVLLMVCGPVYYTIRILNPFMRTNQLVSRAPGFGSDLYPRWVGIRLIFQHQDPYSETTTHAIQAGYYGYALRKDEARDPQRFAYPAHLAVLLAPLGWLDFQTARALFAVLLILSTMLATLMWLRIELNRNASFVRYGIGIVLVLASWPVLQGIYVQQITLLIAACLAAAFYCVSRHQLGAAGLLLACSTVKPQLSWLAVAWLLAWSWSDSSRRRVTWWFTGSFFVLLVASEALVPRWPSKWFSTFSDYMHYTGSRLSLQFLIGNVAGMFLTGAIVIVCGVLLGRARNAEPETEEFGFAAALVTALTLVALPTWSWACYNQVLLVPAAAYLLQHWRWTTDVQVGLRWLYGIALLVLGWSYLTTLYLALIHVAGTAITTESQVRLPTYNFFLVAPLTLLCVYLQPPTSLSKSKKASAR